MKEEIILLLVVVTSLSAQIVPIPKHALGLNYGSE